MVRPPPPLLSIFSPSLSFLFPSLYMRVKFNFVERSLFAFKCWGAIVSYLNTTSIHCMQYIYTYMYTYVCMYEDISEIFVDVRIIQNWINYLSIYLSFYLSIYLSIISLFLCLSICLSLYLYFYHTCSSLTL